MIGKLLLLHLYKKSNRTQKEHKNLLAILKAIGEEEERKGVVNVDAITRAQDLSMMKNPMRWPLWPLLPVVKRPEGKVGVLVDEGGVVAPLVYLRNLYAKEPLEATERLDYIDFDGVLDDGWRVD